MNRSATARLVMTERDGMEPPAIPTIVTTNEAGQIVVCGDWWAFPIPRASLEAVTEADVRRALGSYLPENVSLRLSEARALPDVEFMSPDYLAWAQMWWREESSRREPVATKAF